MSEPPLKFQLYSPTYRNGFRYKFNIPEQYQDDYIHAISKFGKRYDFVAKAFHEQFPDPPYNWRDFLCVMKNTIGLDVTVIAFENRTETKCDGTWQWDDAEKSSLTIFADAAHSEERRKTTIIHECIHAIQDFDEEFKEELKAYPIPIQMRIADRVAEKAAVQVIRPRERVEQDRRRKMPNIQIALKYCISLQMASYN